MKTFLLTTTLIMMIAASANAQSKQDVLTPPAEGKQDQSVPAALDFTVKSIDGEEINMSKYLGKVVVVVNTASKCGMTPQYEQLQELHTKFKDQDVAVLGFPCNQFGGQEPGSEEDIKSFCSENYGVTFDMFSKIDVNGDNASELYKYLKSQTLKPKGEGDVRWNFEKFVIDKTGKPIARFSSRVKPDSDEFMAVIKKAAAAN